MRLENRETRKTRMNNQELNSRTMKVAKRFRLSGSENAGKIDPDFRAGQSTGSCGRRDGPHGHALNALSIIWLALAVGFLLIPGVARAQEYVFQNIAGYFADSSGNTTAFIFNSSLPPGGQFT